MKSPQKKAVMALLRFALARLERPSKKLFCVCWNTNSPAILIRGQSSKPQVIQQAAKLVWAQKCALEIFSVFGYPIFTILVSKRNQVVKIPAVTYN